MRLTGKKIAALRILATPGAIEAMPRTAGGGIQTGIHAGVLAHLLSMGMIEASATWARGIASADLRVTELGHAAIR